MDQSQVITEKRLSAAGIAALIEEKTVVYIIKNYYAPATCTYLADRLLASDQVKPYTHEVIDNGQVEQKYFGVDRVGFPFNLTYGKDRDSAVRQEYYRQARQNSLRFLAAPNLSPIDKLRLELDEVYTHGTTVAAFEGLKMVSGIGRISGHALSHLSAVQPHFDALPTTYADLERQFAANIYLRLPTRGGALEVWDVPSLNPLSMPPKEWRAALPPPLRIAPQLGDLIIFNCRKPHAIQEFATGVRITAQTFIGYQSGAPLMVWN